MAEQETSRQVSFGFDWVAPAEKTARVGSVFARVASRYDLMNDLMSGGLHRLWKDRFVAQVAPRSGEHVLDLAAGTGDISFRMAACGARVTATDINPDMLAVGEARAAERGIEGVDWSVQNAERLDFADERFNACTIAFGIRNVTDIDAALREALRVLRFGGRFYCLEFSQVEWPVASDMYDWYSMNIVPKIGKVVARDEAAYQYLVESIRQFPAAQNFAAQIRRTGFARVKHQTLLGGVVAIHSGWKI